jgi:hypothetical protein
VTHASDLIFLLKVSVCLATKMQNRMVKAERLEVGKARSAGISTESTDHESVNDLGDA